MHIISRDLRKGTIRLGIDNELDLWHLTHVIKKSDIIEAKSHRVVEFEKEQERKPVHLSLQAETIEFSPYVSKLRISGKIMSGTPEEYVQIGRHHSIDVSEGDIISIAKEKWMNYELERLDDAVKDAKKERVYVVLVDERKALVAVAYPYGFEIRGEIESKGSKRMGDKELSREKTEYFKAIGAMVPKGVYLIVAGPGFEKDYFSDHLKRQGYDPVKKPASYVTEGSLKEIIEDSESLIIEERLKKEAETYEELARHVFKGDGYAAYGREEVKNALEMNAVELLAIEDSLLKDDEVSEMMKKADGEGSKVFIFSSKTVWGEKVKGLGGIMAKLRYKLK